ncbi:hypothetical protein P3L10_007975 [Capsicum annuum]
MASPLPSRPPRANNAASGAAINEDCQPSLHAAAPSSGERPTAATRPRLLPPQRYLRQTPSAFQPCNPSSLKMTDSERIRLQIADENSGGFPNSKNNGITNTHVVKANESSKFGC